jgi:starch synthase (maltosyl-transferring)
VLGELTPMVDGGRFPIKRVVGEPVTVGVTAFADGHDRLRVVVSHRASSADPWTDVVMYSVNPGLDRWEATFVPLTEGSHCFEVRAWIDHVATWRDAVGRKVEAGVDITSDIAAGAALLDGLTDRADPADADLLGAAAARLRDGTTDVVADPGSGDDLEALAHRALRVADATISEQLAVLVERERALFSTWYELFPRSAAPLSDTSGIGDTVGIGGTGGIGGTSGPGDASGPAGDADATEIPTPSTDAADAADVAESTDAADAAGEDGAPSQPGPDVGPRHGTLADVTRRLEEFADLGIDVLYLPPVHPIGTAFRKGPDNAAHAGPDDPGSPWAIGGPEGGHTAVHPDLGTVDDVASLAAAAAEMGIDLALDLAFQCSPDHPWVTEHPEWFRHRPDGSIQYAENPPKKYQDIYPLDFEGPAWSSLWDELLAVTLFWCGHGIRVFRVDNPHTKPFAFWEWLITEVQARHPGTIFLAEAFTRPKVMRRLGQVGFTQGYSYFTWRTSKAELVDYFTELSSAPSVDEFRPNLWPTTPDILPWHLQHAPLEAFALRLLLAATLAPSYGVYGPGYELGDNEPAGNGKEEFGASEKYEIRRWDLSRRRTLRPLLADLNRIRRDHLALHTLRTLRFHATDNDALICFSKTPHRGPSVDPALPALASVLVVVNLDPAVRQGGLVHLDLEALGVDPSRPYVVDDVLGGQAYVWHGTSNIVELDPGHRPGHVFRVTQPSDPADVTSRPTPTPSPEPPEPATP